jgi:hypothetical protein
MGPLDARTPHLTPPGRRSLTRAHRAHPRGVRPVHLAGRATAVIATGAAGVERDQRPPRGRPLKDDHVVRMQIHGLSMVPSSTGSARGSSTTQSWWTRSSFSASPSAWPPGTSSPPPALQHRRGMLARRVPQTRIDRSTTSTANSRPSSRRCRSVRSTSTRPEPTWRVPFVGIATPGHVVEAVDRAQREAGERARTPPPCHATAQTSRAHARDVCVVAA